MHEEQGSERHGDSRLIRAGSQQQPPSTNQFFSGKRAVRLNTATGPKQQIA